MMPMFLRFVVMTDSQQRKTPGGWACRGFWVGNRKAVAFRKSKGWSTKIELARAGLALLRQPTRDRSIESLPVHGREV
jgi:hypothetical protein